MPSYLYDFNGTDTADGSGVPTPVGFPTLTVISGSWRRLSNRAYTPTDRNSNPILAVEIGGGDVDESISVSSGGGDALYARVTDANNWIRARIRNYTTSGGYYSTEYEWRAHWNHYATTHYDYPEQSPNPGGVFEWKWHWSSTSPPSFASSKSVNHSHNSGNLWHTHNYTPQPGISEVYWTGDTRQVWNSTSSTNYQVILEKCVNGVVTVRDTKSISSPNSLRLRAVGESIQVHVNGSSTATISVTEAQFTNVGRHGIGRGASDNNGQAIDNFSIDPLNTAPNTPTLATLTGGATIDLGKTNRASHNFSDPDPGDYQTGFDHRYRPRGAATWTYEFYEQTTSHYVDLAPNLFSAEEWEREVRVYDSQGQASGWSSLGYFFAAVKPAGPTISDPINGSTISFDEKEISWVVANQSHYQVRVLDLAGAVIHDSGEIQSASTRSYVAPFPTNQVDRRIQVRVQHNLLWSDYAEVTVDVSYTPPRSAIVSARPVDALGVGEDHTMLVEIDNPPVEETVTNLFTNPSFETTSGEVVVQESIQGYGGSTPAANAASAPIIDLDYLGAQGYVDLRQTSGIDYVSVPDSDELDVIGDIDIRVQVALDDWTPGSYGTFIAKRTSTSGEYHFRVSNANRLELVWWESGAAKIVASTISNGIADRAVSWVRVTRENDNGTGVYEAKFYTSPDGVLWTQLGSTITGASVANPTATAATVRIGEVEGQSIKGRVYAAQVYDGIDGTLVADFDADDFEDKAIWGAVATDSVGNEWTLSGAGTKVHTRKALWFPGTAGNYVSTPDKNELDYDSSTFENGIGKWEGLNKNLLTADDSSFENGVGNWSGGVARDTTKFKSGIASLRISRSTAGDIMVNTPYGGPPPAYQVIPGQVYTFSAYFKAEATPRKTRLGIRFGASNSTYLGLYTVDGVDNTSGWTQVVATFQAPANCTAVTLLLYVIGVVANENHYVDEVSLMETPNGNLVSNPDFENNIEGWGTANTAPAISRSTEMAYTGVAGLKVEWQTAGAENGDARCNVPTIVGETYTASAWVYVPAGGVDSGLRVAAGNSNTVTTRDTWVRATRTWVATSTSTPIQLINHAASASGQATYFDAVQVVKGSVALPYLPPKTTNLVPNPSFEVDLSDWSNYGASFTRTRDTSRSFVGAASQCVTATADTPTAGAFHKELLVKPGEQYTFSCYVWSPNKAPLLNYWFRGADGSNVIGTQILSTWSAQDSWQRITHTLVVPQGAVSVEFRVYMSSALAGHALWIDAVQFEHGSVATPYVDGSLGAGYSWDSSENLLTNPSFETDVSGWSVNRGTATRVTSQAYVGTASVEYASTDNTGGNYIVTSPRVPVAPNSVYTSSAYVKGDGAGTQNGMVGHAFFDSAGTLITGSYTYAADTPLDSSWKRLQHTSIPAPANAASMQVYVQVGMNLPVGRKGWIDAVQTEQRPFATPYGQTGIANSSTSTRQNPWVLGGTSLETLSTPVRSVGGEGAKLLQAVIANYPNRQGARTAFAVSPSSTYTLSFQGYSSGQQMFVRSLSDGSILGSVTNITGDARWSTTFTTNSSTTAIALENVRNAETGSVFLDAVQLEKSATATTYVPPLRITGDIDIRAKVALEDWTPGTTTGLVSKGYGIGYWFTISVTGNLALTCVVDGSQYGRSSTVPVPSSNGEPYWVRVTRSTSLGEFRFYTSSDGAMWSQLGDTLVSNDAAMQHSNTPLVVGSSNQSHPLKGKVLNASVHAGIDGPVVAEFRPQEADAPGTTWTDSTGRVWTISRSGDATAELVDRNTWAFTGVEQIKFPDREELDYGTESFVMALNFATRAATRSQKLGKRPGTVIRGLGYGSGAASVEIRDASSNYVGATEPTKTTVDGLPHSVVGQIDRSNQTISILTDGVVRTSASTAAVGSVSNESSLRIGHYGDYMGQDMTGLVGWYTEFRRTLTTAEHTELAAWDGTIANEPAWLRDAATLYVNADDPYTRELYRQHNYVLNLADGFTGDTADDATFDYVWSGVAFQSTAQKKAAQVVSASISQSGVNVAYADSGTVALVPSGLRKTGSMVAVGGDAGGMRINMEQGKRYTALASVEIPDVPSSYWANDGVNGMASITAYAGPSWSYISVGSTPIEDRPMSAGTYNVSLTFDVPVGVTEAFVRLYSQSKSPHAVVKFHNFILVEGDYDGGYFDGDTPLDDKFLYSWNGTPHASTSEAFDYHPAPSSNNVWVRIKGDQGDGIRIAQGRTINTDFIWYAAASETEYEFRIRTYGDNGTSTWSDWITPEAMLEFEGILLHDPYDNIGSLLHLRYNSKGASDSYEIESSLLNYQGREFPVVEFGDASERNINVALIQAMNGEAAKLRELVKRRVILLYRDSAGRKAYGQVRSNVISDAFYGADTSLEVVVTDYDESV